MSDTPLCPCHGVPMRWSADRRRITTGGRWRCTVMDVQFQFAHEGKHRMRAVFNSMRYRCQNPNRWDYPYYGGRGIEVRLASFEEFIAEIGPRPGTEHSVDRVDCDGHYEPGNVRWATRSEQRKNQRTRTRQAA